MFQMLNGGIFFRKLLNFIDGADDLKHIDAIRFIIVTVSSWDRVIIGMG